MKQALSIGAAALALALAGCGGDGDGNSTNLSSATGTSSAPLPQIAAPNNGDWTETVTMTERGGFLMGNPNAPVKLIEYASITCSHCAEFSEQGGAILRDRYVRSGQVSWEYRPYMIFPTDPGIFMLLRCLGPGAFFRVSEQLYADQRTWAGRLQTMPREQAQQLDSMTPQQQAATLLRVTQLDQFFRQRGLPEARMNSCLADSNNLQQLGEITRRATAEDGVGGTPTFIINGEKTDADRWSRLEPLLRNAVGG
ncbi:MAG TPA: thioredoxin domain-containing protein [Allosphingosinicella sp.]|nr:thioredoxin domain-containing protein [Allosphingosinicella sp.]